jgi:hypothetical protein
MAQYRKGTVQIDNGDNIVYGVDPSAGNPDPADDVLAAQEFMSEVQAGDLFYIEGDPIAYVVQSPLTDTSLSLTTNYQGATVVPSGTPLKGAGYAVHRDFSANYAFPLTSQGDIGLAVIIQRVIVDLDIELKAIDDRVVALEPVP